MSRRTNRTIRTLAAVLIAATLAPSSSLADHDLRSQDALDAARSLPPEQLVAVSEGLRPSSRDLRSQDVLDAARSLPLDQLVAVGEGLRSEAASTTVRADESEGFDWPSAVIGAAGMLGLIGVRRITRRPVQA
jgi:hypothetical protein